MRRSTLVLLLVGLVDAVLIGLMIYLIYGIQEGTVRTAIEQGAALERVTTILGGAAGAFTALGLLAFAALRFMKN